MKKIPGWLKLVLKIAVSAACLYYVGQKINWADTWALLQKSNKLWLLAAMLFFIASKVVSSFRLNVYFKNISIHLSEAANLRLYWLGMFYNLFLPGGIGGDAYKVILLNKEYTEVPVKKITAAVLLDRISGLAGLGILAALFYCYLFRMEWHGYAVAAAIIPGMFVFLFVVKKWFPSFVTSFYSTLWLGIAVQALQVICVYGIMQSIGIHHQFAEFQFLFLLSSVVAIFPFTIGGLGAREIVFLWGSQQFGLLQHEAVFISLLFYIITALVSLFGLVWVYRSPLHQPQSAA
ncbi:MAG TPA: lysylphosphatidylglycerol synthase transmembrane domain-containing protein [Phnomibacter sp.]|nr:lysylphosphatidylglycerol synthase transmembrane domain-containing protein [Phnomibacter sp.]